MLDINYVIWNVLPFTDAITFPNSQTDISIFEVVEATKMLTLILYRECSLIRLLCLLQLLFPSLINFHLIVFAKFMQFKHLLHIFTTTPWQL